MSCLRSLSMICPVLHNDEFGRTAITVRFIHRMALRGLEEKGVNVEGVRCTCNATRLINHIQFAANGFELKENLGSIGNTYQEPTNQTSLRRHRRDCSHRKYVTI